MDTRFCSPPSGEMVILGMHKTICLSDNKIRNDMYNRNIEETLFVVAVQTLEISVPH